MTQPSDAALKLAREICETVDVDYWVPDYTARMIAAAIDEAKREEREAIIEEARTHYVRSGQLDDPSAEEVLVNETVSCIIDAIRNRQP